jgi:SAM-dependent methyltransferase
VPSDNQAQIDYWNGPAGDRWVRNQERMDASLRQFGAVALAAARPAAGERVLDVGCGCGDTTLALADRAPGSWVLGLDVSTKMLGRARARAEDRPGLTFVAADAARAPLAPGSFDAVVSRFGLMFFADPPAGFRSLRAAARPRGRLAFVCWCPVAENLWARIGLEAVADLAPPPTDPDAPGPFSLRDPERVHAILDAAGWADVTIAGIDGVMQFGTSADVAAVVDTYGELGPVARVLAGLDDAGRAAARVRLAGALAPHIRADGVRLPARAWLVTAVAG